MSIHFTKMHGLGNDFMVIDGINQTLPLTESWIYKLAKRDTGVGFDQCLIVEKSSTPTIDFYYRIFNADGREVGQCGNGARCLARFVSFYGLTSKKTMRVATKSTQMVLTIQSEDKVSVELEKPKLNPSSIPFMSDEQKNDYQLVISPNFTVTMHVINVGNPHAVLLVDNLDEAKVEELGQAICTHKKFPEQTNVGFMKIIDPKTVYLRVFERGAGETKACGSGAVAAAAIGRLYHGLQESINVHLKGGVLSVKWPNTDGPITLIGPASFVYEGTLMAE